jgi:hypothetical protein
MDPGTIHWVKMGFAAHRIVTRPPVPNLDAAKQRLELNYAQAKGWHPFDGSLLWDVVDHPPLWAIA